MPVVKGYCKYIDIERLELYDFIVMNEMILVDQENERRAQEIAEKRAK